MRKRTIRIACDTIFWYLLYFLPIIITLCLCLGAFQGEWTSSWDGDPTTAPFAFLFGNVLYDFEIFYQNPVYTTLVSIFGENGVLPFFSEYSVIFTYFTYFVSVYLLHLVVDFILFIPRLCHKWMNKFTQSEDCV